ncbi:MAG: 2OG-Fe(II) oxygenase [Hyphomonadaceae bacterium]|nr:2OG-Fe(II) oxygenase [Hyphomonadaceae bacterium]
MAGDPLVEAKKHFAPGGDIALGLQRLNQEAEQGNGEALALLAHFAASGLTGKPDWDKSVQMLAASADLGWEEAARELRALGGGPPSAGELDIRSLVAPRPTEVLSHAPRIRACRSFFSPAECDWLIERGGSRLERAGVYDAQSATKRIVSARNNSAAQFSPFEMDTVLVFLTARIGNTISLPPACFEPTSILHYGVNEQFETHYDFLDPAEAGMAADLNARGQRVVTFLVYLNDGYEGGETYFPQIDLRFKGRRGDALFFVNIQNDGSPDLSTLHAGLPPTSGEKWLLSQWVRNRPPR